MEVRGIQAPKSGDGLSRRTHRATSLQRRRRRAVATAVALSLGLVATSCGARVGPYLGAGGLGGSSATTQPGATAGLQGSTATTAAGAPSGAQGAPGATNGASAPKVAAPASFDFSPQAEAADCSGSAGNTASDAGVTASQVNFGNVSGITGPLSGSFTQGRDGVNALFGAVNAAGGICGRKLSLLSEDDQQNTSTNAQDTQDLISKGVLAFVGGTSDADNGGVPIIQQAGVPDFGFAINCNRSESPDYWSPAAGSCYQPQGAGKGPYYINDSTFLLMKQYNAFPAKMAFLAFNIAISQQAAQQFAYVYKNLGGDVCYEDTSISPTTSSLESDVAAMQQNGCTGVYTTMDVTGNAKLLQAIQQQAYNIGFVGTTFDGYTPVQIQTAGESAAQGLHVALPFVPLNENQTMVQLYVQQLNQFEPGSQPSGFGFLAWSAAQMMIYCLIAAGHNPTKASLTKEVSSLTNWTGGGALGSGYTPNTHGTDDCTVDVVVKGNAFVRDYPPSGLFCGGQAVQASS